jgi:putative redox protein
MLISFAGRGVDLMVQKTVAKVSDAQGSPLAVAIEVSGHHLTGDEPVAQGGRNLGPTPYDLLTAALGECTAMTIRWYAMRQGWPVEHVHVEVSHGKKMQSGSDQMIDEFRKTISITAPDLADEQISKLHEIAAKCPVHKTLTGSIRIETDPPR